MQEYRIRSVKKADLAALSGALKSLSRDIGDPYCADQDSLEHALFGAPPAAWAQITDGSDGPGGIVLFSPLFSTVRGGPGVYVSDLWVEPAVRGKGLGPALLQSAAQQAAGLWKACFMRLAVYPDNTGARTVYDALGFQPVEGETAMVVTGQAFQDMRGQ